MTNPANLSHEQILALKANAAGRAPISTSEATSYARGDHDISKRAEKVSRPNIEGSGAYVTSPNLDRFNKQAAARELEYIEQEEARKVKAKANTNEVLRADIEFLRRQLKKAEARIKKLEA